MTSLTGRHDTTYRVKDALGSEVKNTQGSKEGLFFRLLTTGVRCALGISDDIVTSDDVTSLYESLTGTWGRHDDDVTGRTDALGRHNDDVTGRAEALGQHNGDITVGSEALGHHNDDVTAGAEALGHHNDDITGRTEALGFHSDDVTGSEGALGRHNDEVTSEGEGADGGNRGPAMAQEEVQLSQTESSPYRPQDEDIAATQNVPCADDVQRESPYLLDGRGDGAGSGSAHVDEDLVTDGPDEGPDFLVHHQYQNENGGSTTINVRVGKMVVGAGTCIQIGSANSCYQGSQGGDVDDSSESSSDWSDGVDSSSEGSSSPSSPSSPSPPTTDHSTDHSTDHHSGHSEQLTTTSLRQEQPRHVQGARTKRKDRNSNFQRVQETNSRDTRENLVRNRNLARNENLGRNENLAQHETDRRDLARHETDRRDLANHETDRRDLARPVACDVKTTRDDDDSGTFPVTNMFVDVSEEMFVGREEQLAKLDKMLNREKVAAVSGMGGSGKTTFACLYAYRNQHKYKNGIFFVDASNLNTLPINFAALAGPDVLNLVPSPDEDVATSGRLVAKWLVTHSDYLLIYDACDKDETLQRLGKQTPWDDYRYIPPRMRLRGHVMVTTRCPARMLQSVQVMHPVDLEDLGLRDTCTFLWRRVYGQREPEPEEREQLETLVRGDVLPGRLPLHLEQTASHIRRKNLTFRDYMEEVRQRRERKPVGPPCFGDNLKTVDDAFIDNFEAVAESSSEAAALLNMAALCHSRNIPFALFSVGALALMRMDIISDETIGELVDHLMTDIPYDEEESHPKEVFERASDAGRRAVRELLAIPDESQLVKFARGGSEFTVHEVIQEQLRLRMKAEGDMIPALTALAHILLYMMKSDDVSLLNKRLFLAHAEKCAEYMKEFGPQNLNQDQDQIPFAHLRLRLRAKTAFVFALLGSFPTAHEIVAEIESVMPAQNNELLRVELLGLKARICVWQHQPNEGLRFGEEGLQLMRYGDLLNNRSDPYQLTEYAFLRKSCAHALISKFETESPDVTRHLEEAKRVFSVLNKSPAINCLEEYSHLLMLQGLLHRNVAARHPNPRGRLEELRRACLWLQEALKDMDEKNYLIETCKTHLYLVEFDLGHKSVDQVLASLQECRDALDTKLGRFHRYTAWVLGKMARILMDTQRVSEALDLVQESLLIQENVYGKDAGMVQIGQTKLLEGEALILMSRPKEAVQALEKAERHLERTPKNPAYSQVCKKLQEARALTNLPQNGIHGDHSVQSLQGKPHYGEDPRDQNSRLLQEKSQYGEVPRDQNGWSLQGKPQCGKVPRDQNGRLLPGNPFYEVSRDQSGWSLEGKPQYRKNSMDQNGPLLQGNPFYEEVPRDHNGLLLKRKPQYGEIPAGQNGCSLQGKPQHVDFKLSQCGTERSGFSSRGQYLSSASQDIKNTSSQLLMQESLSMELHDLIKGACGGTVVTSSSSSSGASDTTSGEYNARVGAYHIGGGDYSINGVRLEPGDYNFMNGASSGSYDVSGGAHDDVRGGAHDVRTNRMPAMNDERGRGDYMYTNQQQGQQGWGDTQQGFPLPREQFRNILETIEQEDGMEEEFRQGYRSTGFNSNPTFV